jgi:beta-lactam-binding protein with PASTA domain
VARTTRRVGDEDRDGIVVDQAPGAGAERREGSTITIVVGEAREEPKPKPEETTLVRPPMRGVGLR